MALSSASTNPKATSSQKSNSKTKSMGTVENTFTIQESYIYELLNNKLNTIRKESELNYESLKAEIASTRELLKAEIASNRELFLAHFESVGNQFKTMRWVLSLIFIFIFGIATKLFFF